MELNETCSKCTKFKEKKCKGYYFAVKILNFHCKEFEESKGKK